MKIREAGQDEFLKIYDFVSNCKPLEPYPAHLYKIFLRYFKATFLVAEEKGDLLGFSFGFIAQSLPQTAFFWQIGVSPQAQGRGIGKELVSSFEKKAKEAGCRRLELTVDFKNIPSQKLFEKMGYKNASSGEGPVVGAGQKQAAKDYYGLGRHFIIYAKDLVSDS